MARSTTYTQQGQKKDLSDIVENISPAETPFQQMCGNEKAINKLFSWTEEELSAPTDNALVEGGDAGTGGATPLQEYQNYTQIYTKVIDLSGTSQSNEQAGNVQTMAHQVAMKAKELKRDVEYSYCGTGQVAVAGTSADARKTAGYQAQAAVVKDLANAAISEDVLEDALLSLSENGATPDVVMAHPRLVSALVKKLSGTDNRIRDLSDSTKLVNKVIKYVSNCGEVEIHSNRFVKWDAANKVGDIMVFDSSMWDEKVLRPYKVEDLAKTGDADRKMLVVEKGLMCRAPKSAALLTNVGIA